MGLTSCALMHGLTFASCFTQMMHRTASRFPDNFESISVTSSPAFQLFEQCRDRYLALYPAAKDPGSLPQATSRSACARHLDPCWTANGINSSAPSTAMTRPSRPYSRNVQMPLLSRQSAPTRTSPSPMWTSRSPYNDAFYFQLRFY